MSLEDMDLSLPDGDTNLVSELDDFIRELKRELYDFGTTEHYGDGTHKIPSGSLEDMNSFLRKKEGALFFVDDTLYIYNLGEWRPVINISDISITGTSITNSDTYYSVGSGGDYATIQEALESLPSVLADTVTLTIKKGSYTDYLDTSTLRVVNSTSNGKLVIKGEKYLNEIRTATGGATTYLEDSNASWVINEWQGCWVFIVDGTGKNNGMVQITSNDETKLYVASWPGTQPDDSSKYMISGVKFTLGGNSYGWLFNKWRALTELKGIFFESSESPHPSSGMIGIVNSLAGVKLTNVGIHESQRGVVIIGGYSEIEECGIVKTVSDCIYAYHNPAVVYVTECSLSDSVQDSAIKFSHNSNGFVKDCYGSGNNDYGIDCLYCSNVIYEGTIPSGDTGNTHNDNKNSYVGE
ncbi:MAG: hypothetical protein DRN81_05085 [Thermoproteota archaeon]|nr:MAG: hypothetical protein DRN81_05085 [Candidatus Korarchaeota archaeon]